MKNNFELKNFKAEISNISGTRTVTIRAKAECLLPSFQTVAGQQKLHKQLIPHIRKEFNAIKNVCEKKKYLSDRNKEEVLNFMAFTASTMLALHYQKIQFSNMTANAITFDVYFSDKFTICTNTNKPIPIFNVCSLQHKGEFLYIDAKFKMKDFSDDYIEDFAEHIINSNLETFNPFPYIPTTNTKGA